MMIDFRMLWPKYNIRPAGVLHLGANTGQEAEVYDGFGVKEVVWIEAIPSVAEQLAINVEKYGHTTVCACVGDVEGKDVVFKISNNEAQSSSYLDLGHHKVIHPEVHFVDTIEMKMRRLDKMFTWKSFPGPWFLNADLQGAELQAFIGMGDLILEFPWIYTEVNKRETYIGGASVLELDNYLGKYGFVRVETGHWVGDTWTDALYINGIALKGKTHGKVS